MIAADAKIRIFDAITELFNEGGIEAVTMASIGAKCNLHKSSLVYYFSTKDEMLRAYYEYYLEEHDKAFFDDIEAFIDANAKTDGAFCRLIDMILVGTKNAPSLADIASADIIYLASKDPDLHRLLTKKFHRMADYFYGNLRKYCGYGFLAEERFEQGVCDLMLMLSSVLYLDLHNIRLPRHEETVGRSVENVKRSFLKDDVYKALQNNTKNKEVPK